MSDIVIKSNKTECSGIGISKRECPTCKRTLVYKNIRSFKRATINNQECQICSRYGKPTDRKLFSLTRKCPQCNKELKYSSKEGCYKAKKHQSICKTCSASNQYDFYKSRNLAAGLKQKAKTNPWQQKTADIRKRNGTYFVTEEVREKHRINKINQMIANGTLIWPNYNRKACLMFDRLEKEFQLDGWYATKNKEKRIGRFWVDYYDPTVNLVIEHDEPYHFDSNGTLKTDDVKRQNWITSRIQCIFIRITETTTYEELSNILSNYVLHRAANA